MWSNWRHIHSARSQSFSSRKDLFEDVSQIPPLNLSPLSVPNGDLDTHYFAFSDQDENLHQNTRDNRNVGRVHRLRCLDLSYLENVLKHQFGHLTSFLRCVLCMPKHYSPEEMNSLNHLSYLASISYDENNVDHETFLQRYWETAFPDLPYNGNPNPHWLELGFQSQNPRTDFRGGGILSLMCMVYFAVNKKQEFNRIKSTTSTPLSYPFSAAFVNIAFMLMTLLHVVPRSKSCHTISRHLSPHAYYSFVKLLCRPEEHTFEEVFCYCCIAMHKRWLQLANDEPNITLIDFQKCLRSTLVKTICVLESYPSHTSQLRYIAE